MPGNATDIRRGARPDWWASRILARGGVQGAVKFWTKRRDAAEAGRGVARAALEGASRVEILREAICELRAEDTADRLGVWLAGDHEDRETGPAEGVNVNKEAARDRRGLPAPPLGAGWRGVTWDRETEAPPAEWEQMSAEAPIPREVLLGARAVAQKLPPGTSGTVLISILVGMQRVLWVPIASRGGILGVILCAARAPGQELPGAAASRLAAELALQLAWKEERAVARERHADLAVARRLHAELNAQGKADAALAGLTDSIVDSSAPGGLGAVFASIGVLADTPGTEPAAAALACSKAHGGASSSNGTDASVAASGDTTLEANPLEANPLEATGGVFRLAFHWKSGDADSLHIAEGPELEQTWQEALRTRRTTGMEPRPVSMHTPIARIVAVPIQTEGVLRGVLLVGLARRDASLAVLERLEYRALLAGVAIARQKRERQEGQTARRQRAQLAAARESLFVLDDRGWVADLSAAADELLRETSGGAEERPTSPSDFGVGEPFSQLFGAGERSAVEEWLRRDGEAARGDWNAGEEDLEAGLRTGLRVRLRRGLSISAGHSVVALDRVAEPQRSAEQGDAEQTLQGVIEWLEEGVVLFDARGQVRACNTRFEQLAGPAAGTSAKGATLEELIARMQGQAGDPATFAARWRELARAGEGGVRDELRMTQPTPRILERAARPVLDAAGRKLGRVEIYRDLTAQRVFQSQLLQTEKLAALGQMITGVAHELSNPLTSILGYAQRLLLREDPSGGLPEVRQIFQEAERAGGILRQLLFSARETPPERRRVALNQVVMRSMELQRFSMTAEKVRVQLDLDPSLPMVMGDAAQLQQVLMNLVGNARQAIQQHGRGGWICVRTRQTPERRVQLNVEDDGPGVPQSILARIFDPFFTTKAAGVGTGLGLSIVLSIVREARRTRERTSRTGRWRSFFHRTAGGGRPSRHAGGAPESPRGGIRSRERRRHRGLGDNHRRGCHAQFSRRPGARAKVRVLVVEDEPTVARLIADVLHDEGFVVDVLLDGREALERVAEETFDLVICDMKMPGLDGQHFFQSLAESGNPLQHSFLFVTGDVIAPARQAFLERSGLPHLAKPFRMEELTARVHQVLDDSAHPRAHAKALSATSGAQENSARK